MLANTVSPPTSGMTWQWKSDPSGGRVVYERSVCQWRPTFSLTEGLPPTGIVLRTRSSGCSGVPERLERLVQVQHAEAAAEGDVLVD